MPYRSRRKRTLNSRAATLLRPRWISGIFPIRAKTKLVTTANLKQEGAACTLVDGFKNLGFLSVSSIKDPMGNLDNVEGGADVTDSTLEAGGFDRLNLIYNAFSVYKVHLSIRWQNISAVAAHRPILVAIPGLTTTTPAADWYEVMNHPLAVKSYAKDASTNHKSSTLSLSIFPREFATQMWNQVDTEMGEPYQMHAFATTPGDGQGVKIWLYILDLDSSIDANTGYLAAATLTQWVALHRAGEAADTSINLATDYDVKLAAE